MFRQSKHVRATPFARQLHVSPAFAGTLLMLGLAVETLVGARTYASPSLTLVEAPLLLSLEAM